MPDINHEWARNPGERWHCQHCPATTWNPVRAVCPGRVEPKTVPPPRTIDAEATEPSDAALTTMEPPDAD